MNFEREAEQMWDSGWTDEEVTDYLTNLIHELVMTYYAGKNSTSPSEMHYYLVHECGMADWRATGVVAFEFDLEASDD